MNKKVVLVGAAAGLVAVALLTSTASGEPLPPALFDAVFTIKDAATQAPVPGAFVSCGGASASTNSAGVCTIGLAAAGTYEFTVSASGYAQFAGEFTTLGVV